MELEIGAVLTGKVTGITKFGAFVQLESGKSGLVHISEIANVYVNDVHDFLSDGQEVKVKVIGIDEAGRINLSIKQASESPAQQRAAYQGGQERPRYQQAAPTGAAPANQPTTPSFEDKLKRFLQDSDSKISSIKQYSEHRTRRRTRN